jgi:hypothetical protein
MNVIKKRLSPLAIVFIAIAAVLALSSTANAQSTSTVLFKYSGSLESEVGKAVTASGSNATLQPANSLNFTQRWQRENAGTNEFRFNRAGFANACLRVPSTMSSTDAGGVQIGSCSGTRAEWRRVFAAGAGDMYVNVATGHVLTPPICIIGPCSNQIGLLPRAIVGTATDVVRWTATVV